MSRLEAKKKFAVLCAVIAVLWTAAAFAFPMETYSLFFASNVGSMLLLLLMGAVITGPLVLAASYAMKLDIKLLFAVCMNSVLLTVFINLYSIFRYDKPYLLLLTAFVHIAAMCALFIFAPSSGTKAKKKNGKSKKKNSGKSDENLPRITAAFVFTMVSYFFYMLIFHLMIDVFVR